MTVDVASILIGEVLFKNRARVGRAVEVVGLKEGRNDGEMVERVRVWFKTERLRTVERSDIWGLVMLDVKGHGP